MSSTKTYAMDTAAIRRYGTLLYVRRNLIGLLMLALLVTPVVVVNVLFANPYQFIQWIVIALGLFPNVAAAQTWLLDNDAPGAS